jgi:hypothetical protein
VSAERKPQSAPEREGRAILRNAVEEMCGAMWCCVVMCGAVKVTYIIIDNVPPCDVDVVASNYALVVTPRVSETV